MEKPTWYWRKGATRYVEFKMSRADNPIHRSTLRRSLCLRESAFRLPLTAWTGRRCGNLACDLGRP